jgi:sarcosine oxidase subunit gamma
MTQKENFWMPDSINVLESSNNPLDGRFISVGSGAELQMQPSDQSAQFSLRVAKSNLNEASEAFGLDIPSKIGKMVSEDQKMAICLGPDEWLLMAPLSEHDVIEARFAILNAKTLHSLVDVGHRTVGIEITGPAAAVTLNTGCPLNLENLPIGGCARTVLDKAEIILIRLDSQRYLLEVIRSFADYVWMVLTAAGRELLPPTTAINKGSLPFQKP